MTALETIRKPVERDLVTYEDFIRESLRSDSAYIRNITDYIFDNRGKGFRPLLVMLSAAMLRGGGPFTERTAAAAMLVEMMHTASLVHDDVVDGASTRRGKPSVNAVWRSRTAVLAGDYILARSFGMGIGRGEYDMVGAVTESVGLIAEGELIQNEHSGKLSMTRDIYFDIISRKTASLTGASCRVGAMSVDAPRETVEAMYSFGHSLGMAFQIRDDILDYTLGADTGKPVCGDLRERKITLPLLHVLESSTHRRRRELAAMLADVDSVPQNIGRLHEVVVGEGGLEAAASVMEGYISSARDMICGFPASEVRDSLEGLCGYVGERDR